MDDPKVIRVITPILSYGVDAEQIWWLPSVLPTSSENKTELTAQLVGG